MRKLLVFCLTLVMLLSLSACGKGSLKDILIDGYDNLIQSVSKHALTESKDLVGERENGVDEYTGSMRILTVKSSCLVVRLWSVKTVIL